MNNILKLKDKLVSQLLADLDDPSKCTPGLYQVVCRVVVDHKDEIDLEGIEQALDKMSLDPPFKFGT
tara:strand:+ start:506 stop:706 length:201 start_codon:yes stop_codon:yes gene_type:complete